MKIKNLFFIIIFSAVLQSLYAQPYFIYGRLFDSNGNSGNANTENSFASVALFREGISGQIGKQNNGPDAIFSEKIYPAGHNNVTIPAYCFTDVGSTDWLDTVNPPQKVRAVFQVMNGVNGWSGGTFVGMSLTEIKPADMPGSKTELADAGLIEVPAPRIVSIKESGIDIEFKGLNYPDVTGYGLYRENIDDNVTDRLAVLEQAAGAAVSYSDTSAAAGKTYRYSVSVIFKWGAVPAGYETFVKSRPSVQCIIPLPSATITQTITPTHTVTVTKTVTMTATITLTPKITMTATVTATEAVTPELKIVKENIMKERVIVFTNPVRGKLMKIGFAAESDCDASVYLYNVTGESAQKFDFKAEKGANIQELVLKNLSPGLYLLRITLNYGDKKDTLPKRKFAVIK